MDLRDKLNEVIENILGEPINRVLSSVSKC